ncbi:hypothetical protein P4234_27965 [Pseudomonas aeruginosa]|nr:hypothetical protein [Pseudomonas aeruginosa]
MAKALISVLLFSLALAGCAGDYNPSRPYSSDEVRQLALEDLARRSLSFEEYQAKRQAILEEKPQAAVQPVQRRPTQYRHLRPLRTARKPRDAGLLRIRGWTVSRRTGA